MKKTRIIILLSFFFFSGCHKKEKDLEQDLIPLEMKAYWDFKPGSWWAYQDSATGAIDTVKEIGYYNKIDTGYQIYNSSNVIYESLEITTYNTGDSFYSIYFINTLQRQIEPSEIFTTGRAKYNSSISHSNECFVFPIKIGNYSVLSYGDDDTTIVIGYLDSLNEFKDVYKIEKTLDIQESFHKSYLYYSKGIGLIKYQVPDLYKVKNLKSYYLLP